MNDTFSTAAREEGMDSQMEESKEDSLDPEVGKAKKQTLSIDDLDVMEYVRAKNKEKYYVE